MTYRIKDWSSFQHFKDRTPPWVKLYRTILDDPDWHALPGDAAKSLVMLWLIASEDKTHRGRLPDARKMAFRLRIQESKMIQHLEALSQWVIRDDINPISTCHQPDIPETETEGETETETETEGERGADAPPIPLVTGKKKSVVPETSKAAIDTLKALPGFDQALWDAWMRYRKTKKAETTGPVVEGLIAKLAKRPADAAALIAMAAENAWRGFEWSWFDERKGKTSSSRPPAPSSATPQRGIQEHIEGRLLFPHLASQGGTGKPAQEKMP